MIGPQSTNIALMIRPAAFGPNPETGSSNSFQSDAPAVDDIQGLAITEFDGLVAAMTGAGIRVLVVDDTPDPAKPDAVFPNNWLSFHDGYRACLHPMYSPIRRAERRQDILEALADHFTLSEAVDYSHEEHNGRFLEGTGSMVLDRVSKTAYVCRSPRSNEEVLEAFCSDFGYESFVFDAVCDGVPIYHTNVLMAIGTSWAVVCSEALSNDFARGELLERLSAGRAVITISKDQMKCFAGNILELRAKDESPALIVMSESAEEAFDDDQYDILWEHGEIISSPLPTIERYGGGSARCMICEVFLDHKSP